MFNPEFFPTPLNVIEIMTNGLDLKGKVILEPSAGKGDIIDFCAEAGASILACELNKDLQKILHTKCKLIGDDFLNVTSDQISHIDLIIMNPPFSNGVEHVLHAYNIAPKGCKIISLLNASNIENTYTNNRKELKVIIDNYGRLQNLGNCFEEAERQTGVKIALIIIDKEGENYKSEFEGFFMEDEPGEIGENGIMSYNVVRDLVNRYVAAMKLYDEQLNTGAKMNSLLNGFYGESLTFTCTEKGAPKLRNEFKKDLQRAGWKFIFNKMDMAKYCTSGVREDINKFVEQQTAIPFTMRNIYHMLQIVVGTASQRMDRAILEAFDLITKHHSDNRYNVKGWKTNSHFLVGKKFILPNMVSPSKEYGYSSSTYNFYRSDRIEDLEKGLCFCNGIDYDNIISLYHSVNRNNYSEWYENHHFFKYKAYKNGNMHFEFKDEEVWTKFNQQVAKLKGYPLFEGKQQTKYQDRQTGRSTQQKSNPAHHFKPTVLFEVSTN